MLLHVQPACGGERADGLPASLRPAGQDDVDAGWAQRGPDQLGLALAVVVQLPAQVTAIETSAPGRRMANEMNRHEPLTLGGRGGPARALHPRPSNSYELPRTAHKRPEVDTLRGWLPKNR